MAPRIITSDALTGREKIWITYSVQKQQAEIHYMSEEDVARAAEGLRAIGEKVRVFTDRELAERVPAGEDTNEWLAKQAEQFASECRQYEHPPASRAVEPFPGYAARRPRDEELEYIPDTAVLPDPPARRTLADLSADERAAKRTRITELFNRGFGQGAESEED